MRQKKLMHLQFTGSICREEREIGILSIYEVEMVTGYRLTSFCL